MFYLFFFSSRRRHTRCALVTGVQTCALPIYLVRLEEAAKRDHRKIGREMDLFHLQEEAHGSVFWHPKGYRIYRDLEAYLPRAIDGQGYQEVKTPPVMAARQWEPAGHWGKHRVHMFVILHVVPNIAASAQIGEEQFG